VGDRTPIATRIPDQLHRTWSLDWMNKARHLEEEEEEEEEWVMNHIYSM
jgi:hypothetical protein